MIRKANDNSIEEEILKQVNYSLECFEDDFNNGKKYIIPGKDKLWSSRYDLLKRRLRLISELDFYTKKQKDIEKDKGNAYFDLIAFHYSTETMKKLSEGIPCDVIKEEIKKLDLPDNIKLRVLRLVLSFSKQGPDFFELYYKEMIGDYDRFSIDETRKINAFLERGASYDDAVEMATSARRLEINDCDDTPLFDGVIILSDDRQSFIGVGKDEFYKNYVDGFYLKDGRIEIKLSHTGNQDAISFYGEKTDDGYNFSRNIMNGNYRVTVFFTPIPKYDSGKSKIVKDKYNFLKSGKKYFGSSEHKKNRKSQRSQNMTGESLL